MRVFCYARKSAFSEKSSSVQNQIDMCKKYIYSKYQDQIEIFEAYTDEDFSGSNTNRPGLQTMMEKVYNGECDLVVVYQLDRLSRSIRKLRRSRSTLPVHSRKHRHFFPCRESHDVYVSHICGNGKAEYLSACHRPHE